MNDYIKSNDTNNYRRYVYKNICQCFSQCEKAIDDLDIKPIFPIKILL